MRFFKSFKTKLIRSVIFNRYGYYTNFVTKGVNEVIKAIEQNINRLMAKEFIESHLDIEPSDEHIERFANCISEIENSCTNLERGNTP